MKLEEVQQAVEKIRSIGSSDPEWSHGLEDDLYRDLLAAIATGKCALPMHCAREALKTKEIDFPRWCA